MQTGIKGPVKIIIDRCKELMRRDWEVRITHVFREQNYVADLMAHKAWKHDRELYVFRQAPSDVKDSLEQDLMKTPAARSITFS